MMNDFKDETLTLDFDCKSCNDKVTKAWANDLTKQLKSSFEKISSAVNSLNANFVIFAQKFDNLEVSLRHEVTAAASAAESASALANENKTAIEQLKQEIVSMNHDHKQEMLALKQEQVKQRQEMELLKNDSKQIKSECVAIKTQTNNMETYSRRDNLLFHGIDQPANESNFSCAKAVRKFMVEQLQFNDGDASAVQFVRCHRLPENNRNAQSKPIIVRFKNCADRELIWSKKSAITERKYNVSEDFPREIAFRRRKLFPVFSKARKIPGTDKKSVTLKSDVLIINGKRYTVETLNQLKGQLDMKHFNERSNNDRVVFGGMFSNFHPLSNYFACPITFRKQSFRSLEHAYQHTKALFFGHEESAARIKDARDPSEAKRISYEITGPRDLQKKWDDQRVDLMTSLVQTKCQQNPDVVKELKLTGNKIIAESGRDRFYATGLPITHKDVLQSGKWVGKSNLGEILMNVRREINQNVDLH